MVGRALRNLGLPPWPSTVKYGDVLKGLPIGTGAADAAYASHVLDHLAREDGLKALREVHRILKPEGIFRTVLHDLRGIAEHYVASRETFAAYDFMRESILGQERRPRGLDTLRTWIGHSQHRWLWDEASLSAEFRHAGFRHVRRAVIGDCVSNELRPFFAQVENPDRWTVRTLALEGRK